MSGRGQIWRNVCAVDDSRWIFVWILLLKKLWIYIPNKPVLRHKKRIYIDLLLVIVLATIHLSIFWIQVTVGAGSARWTTCTSPQQCFYLWLGDPELSPGQARYIIFPSCSPRLTPFTQWRQVILATCICNRIPFITTQSCLSNHNLHNNWQHYHFTSCWMIYFLVLILATVNSWPWFANTCARVFLPFLRQILICLCVCVCVYTMCVYVCVNM